MTSDSCFQAAGFQRAPKVAATASVAGGEVRVVAGGLGREALRRTKELSFDVCH